MKELLKTRPLFCACAAAVVTAALCSFVNSSVMLAFACAAAFGAVFILPLKSRFKFALLGVLAASALMALSFFTYYRFVYDHAVGFADGSHQAELTVISETGNTSSGLHCVDARCLSLDGEDLPRSFKVRVYFKTGAVTVPSSAVTAKLDFFKDSNDDPFDPKGVHVGAYADEITVETAYRPSFAYFCYKIRDFVRNRVTCPDNGAQGLVRAMILGDKNELDPLFKNKLAEIGMSHVTAVSGMHLMFTVLFFDWIFFLLGLGRKKRCVTALCSVVFFTVVSGFSISCIRAGIMLTIFYIGRLVNRTSDALTSLGAAAFLILLAAPYNIRSASFVLSASATLGLIVLAPAFSLRAGRPVRRYPLRRLFRAVGKTVTMSAAATVACVPAMVLIFHRFNYLAPVSNVLLLFAIELMIYVGLLGAVFSFVPFAASGSGALIAAIYKYVSYVTNKLYEFPFTSVSEDNRYFHVILAMLAVLTAGILLYRRKRPEAGVFPFVACYAAVCVLLIGLNCYFEKDVMTVKMLDVGQGNCTVFSKNGRAVVVDCGGSESNEIYEYLRRSGIKRIELIAITHADHDHVRYLNYFLNYCKTDRIIYPSFTDMSGYAREIETAKSRGTEVTASAEDGSYSVLGGARLSVFQNLALRLKKNSNTCAAYKMEYNGVSVFCAGDMDVHEEYSFLDYGNALDCDILVAAHHGSDRSSFQPVLELLTPDYSVVSVGANNYGLPGKKAIERLSGVSKVLRTDELSTVTFKIYGKGYSIEK